MAQSDEILNELREVFNRFSKLSNYTSDRTKQVKEAIYLDSEECPAGASPCDPMKETCPDEEEALQPHIYNSEGLRCYADVNIKKVRTRSALDKRSQQSEIMQLVEQSAKLVAMVKGKLDQVGCGDIKSENLCGMKNTCNWANGVCGTK